MVVFEVFRNFEIIIYKKFFFFTLDINFWIFKQLNPNNKVMSFNLKIKSCITYRQIIILIFDLFNKKIYLYYCVEYFVFDLNLIHRSELFIIIFTITSNKIKNR